jgi:hypothetical protein
VSFLQDSRIDRPHPYSENIRGETSFSWDALVVEWRISGPGIQRFAEWAFSGKPPDAWETAEIMS